MKSYKILAIATAVATLAACSTIPGTKTAQTSTAPASKAQNTPATISIPATVDAAVNAFVVRTVDGQETLEPVTAATAIKSGDIVEYHGLFTNKGTDRVRNMTVTLSLPQGVSFTGQADPALGTKASLDNSRFVNMPIRANVNGAIENLPFDQYKALRWTIEDIGIGATAVVKYRAKVQ